MVLAIYRDAADKRRRPPEGDLTHDGRRYRMLNVLDEFIHECLAIRGMRQCQCSPQRALRDRGRGTGS
jgi:hypothetical protein